HGRAIALALAEARAGVHAVARGAEAELEALAVTHPCNEPHRDCRRLPHLRGWSDNEQSGDEIFTGSAGACGADGGGSPERIRFGMGGVAIDCGEDRLHRADAA
ncbi:MAG: hypothetical protein P8Y67_07245, partial [Alphaproteobacteria bacterium]